MANTIKLKRGTSTPSTSDISNGEVAIDTSAQKLYINDSGTVKEIGSGGIGGASGLDFNDSVKVRFGTGNDLEIYHDGSHSRIDDTGTGSLVLRTSNFLVEKYGGDYMINGVADGAVELYYDNSKKFETQSGGISVTGGINLSTNLSMVDNGLLKLGTGDDLQIYHDGTHSYLTNTTGDLRITDTTGLLLRSNSLDLRNGPGDENYITCAANGAVSLYYDNVKKFETGSYGFGTSANIRLLVDDGSVQFGADQDFKIYHDGNYNIIKGEGAHSTQFWTDNTARWRIQAGGHIMPEASHTYDIGTTSYGVRNVYLADSGKLQLGTSQDLQIYHDGTDSYIAAHVTGNIYARARDGFHINVNATAGGSEHSVKAFANGGVELHYDHSKKFETTSDGVKLPDGQSLTLGDDNDVKIKHQSGHFEINNVTGSTYFQANGQIRLRGNDSGTEEMIIANAAGAVELYYDNSKKFETKSYGAYFHGDLGAADSSKIVLGNSSDFKIYHTGSHSYIDGNNGSIYIRNNVDDWNADHIFIQPKSDEHSAKFLGDGAVELYYDNSKKLETTNTGVSVAGVITTDSGGATTTIDIVSDTESSVIFTDHGGSAKQYKIGTNISSNDSQLEFKDLTAGVKRLEITTGGNVRVPDNGKFVAGTGNDLQIYHNGTNSYLTNATGNLVIDNGSGVDMYINSGNDIYIRPQASENGIKVIGDGSVELFNDNSKKAQTHPDGFEILGKLYMADSKNIELGNSQDLKIYHDGSHSYIKDTGTGELRLASSQFTVQNAASNETLLYAVENAAVGLKYDDSLKLETTSGGVTVTGSLITTANLEAGNNIQLIDNKKLLVGNGNDLQIYHDGSHNKITGINGNTHIETGATVEINKGTTENMAKFIADGAVELYHNNNKKLETSTYGTTLTGNLFLADSSDGNWGRIKVGTGEDLQIYHDGSHSYIKDAGTGTLRIEASEAGILSADGSETMAQFVQNGAVSLRYDNSKKLETTNYGTYTTGIGYVTGGWRPSANGGCSLGSSSYRWYDLNISNDIDISDNGVIRLGDGDDLQIYHDGSHSYIKESGTGDLFIRNGTDDAIRCRTDGTVDLFYDNVKRFETHNNGARISSNLGIGDDPLTHPLYVKGSAQYIAGLHNTASHASYFPWLLHKTVDSKQALGIHFNGIAGDIFHVDQNGAVYLGGETAAANALDEYEEGTFSISIIPGNTGSGGSYSV